MPPVTTAITNKFTIPKYTGILFQVASCEAFKTFMILRLIHGEQKSISYVTSSKKNKKEIYGQDLQIINLCGDFCTAVSVCWITVLEIHLVVAGMRIW
jgi:hypothetical protein